MSRVDLERLPEDPEERNEAAGCDLELTEDDLEQVSGGNDDWGTGTTGSTGGGGG